MPRGSSTWSALFHCACSALLCLAGACSIRLPEGKLRCTSDAECPSGWVCTLAPQANVGRCSSERGSEVTPWLDAAMPGENMVTPDGGEPPPDANAMPPMDAAVPTDIDAAEPPTDSGTSGPRDASEPAVDAGVADTGTSTDAAMPACQPDAPDESQGVFVSPVQSDTLDNCGSRSQPCSTISKGLAQAVRYGRANVYVDSGEYSEDTLRLVPDVTVIGGWDNLGGTWTRSCRAGREASAVLLSSANTAVVAEYDGEATLETLTIRTREPAADSGESTYGVMARGERTRLRVRDVAISAASAAAGAAGAAGESPAVASGSCAADTGADGTSGEPGAAAASGSFGEQGYSLASAGAGTAGGAGLNGLAADIPCLNCRAALEMMYPQLTNCGSTVCFSQYIPLMSCAPMPGASGCGGAAGSGGTPGGSGGSSVALYVWNARVELVRVQLEAGDGGAGAAGGQGGTGAAGSAGLVGPDGPQCMSMLRIMNGPGTTSGPTIRGAIGSQGGPGGRGGDGAAAGSGAGGHTYAIVRGPEAQVSGIETSTLAHGAAGTSAGDGATGQAGDVLQL
jgi:hypothetical protein